MIIICLCMNVVLVFLNSEVRMSVSLVKWCLLACCGGERIWLLWVNLSLLFNGVEILRS